MMKAIRQDVTYFGAANGFYGFRSNFDRIFSSEHLNKLFIIKGGPGTGKSTLLRQIKEKYAVDAKIITILCSSDPDSYDGILITKNGITVGIADGTSPHAIEPEYPGAFEEIVNLGDAFDFDMLSESKSAITELSKDKKANYKSAYASLKIAGLIYDYIQDYFLNSQYYNLAENEISQLIDKDENSVTGALKSDFLIGSFSKCGYKRLSIRSDRKRNICLSGDGISEYISMSVISKLLSLSSASYQIFPSAFSEELPDAIITEKATFYIGDGKDHTVDTTKFMPKNREYEKSRSAYKSFLENALLSLIKASEQHFKLESVYSSAMNFSLNEEKYLDITKKIDTLFDK